MSTASFVAGALFFILATVSRSMIRKNLEMSERRISRLFSLPSRNYPEDAYASVGQIMGISWILIGGFLVLTKSWFLSSLAGVVLEPIVAFSPFLIGGLITKILFSNRH